MAQRHSRRVRHLRLIAPTAALGLLATYALSATPPQIDPEFAREFRQAQADGGTMRLDRPRYVGEDNDGLPFEVAADAAERDLDVPDLIALQSPKALRRLDQEGNEQVRVRANAGLLDTDANRLSLTDTVELEHGQGDSTLILTTQAADLDFESNVVSSTVGVSGKSDRGTVAADNVTAYQGEGRVVLEGNVRLRYDGKSAEETADEATETEE